MNRAISLSLLLCVLVFSGCLKTRGEVSEARHSGEVKDRLSNLQKDVADRNAEFDQVNEELRSIQGRIETLEAAGRQNSESRAMSGEQMASQLEKTNEQLRLLEQEVTKLAGTVQALQQQVQSGRSSGGGGGSSAPAEDMGNFGGAERDFERKNWKDAILGYEKYRELNPRGRRFSESTYKIGFSFEQLGMKPEARAFYEEVVAKDGRSSWARQAQARLKKL